MPVEILALSGSLRAGSSNTALLRAAANVAPDGVRVRMYEGLRDLPPFDPDEDQPGVPLPDAVVELRALVSVADALLLSTPEYAHALPGSFKNALDWLVGSTDFAGKLVAVVTPTTRSVHAQAQLRVVLRTMSATLFKQGTPIVVPLASHDTATGDAVVDDAVAQPLQQMLIELSAAVRRRSHRRSS
jgi:NAD(P)H-dependent FMN reductase